MEKKDLDQITHAIDVSLDSLMHTCITSGRCTVAADHHDAPVVESADVWAEAGVSLSYLSSDLGP
jgi:hypothetical protein